MAAAILVRNPTRIELWQNDRIRFYFATELTERETCHIGSYGPMKDLHKRRIPEKIKQVILAIRGLDGVENMYFEITSSDKVSARGYLSIKSVAFNDDNDEDSELYEQVIGLIRQL